MYETQGDEVEDEGGLGYAVVVVVMCSAVRWNWGGIARPPRRGRFGGSELYWVELCWDVDGATVSFEGGGGGRDFSSSATSIDPVTSKAASFINILASS